MTKCDCTINCGDDPWLADGRAQPCAGLARYQARQRARAALEAERDKARAQLKHMLELFPAATEFKVTRAELEALVTEIRDE